MKSRASLEYACWKIMSKYKEAEEGTVGGLRFNKMMSLLNKELLDVDVDIMLPRCWYFYGEEVVPKELPAQVVFEGSDEDSKRTTFKWSGKSPRKPAKRTKKTIDSKIDSIYSQFPPDRYVFDAANEVYEYAPYDFQRAYRDFRSDFVLWSTFDRNGSFRTEFLYKEEFEKAMELFPTEDFPSLRVPAKKLEMVVKAIFNEQPKQNRIGIEMAIAYWEIFCKFLRIHEKGHQYVSDVRVAYWRETAFADLEDYKKDMQRSISSVLSGLKLRTLSDPLILTFLQPASFGVASRGLSKEIDMIAYG